MRAAEGGRSRRWLLDPEARAASEVNGASESRRMGKPIGRGNGGGGGGGRGGARGGTGGFLSRPIWILILAAALAALAR